eukprot:CAMPEP_0170554934 /NCGR_PEP_ID=MMETSP0211-20121228/12809_1 /TAXON_ID=311385 /ORGANISM="Pseudokeronopsis sp., Strain OXSARD2" /LENGTH=36 /DNA_ID= /DNA_START= /DNA_END= /DNA_ORIENTATION=
MVLEFSDGPMEGGTQGLGLMEDNMEKVHITTLLVKG